MALGDTWQWSGSSWKELSVNGPSARDAAASAVIGGKLVLFGGWETGALSDTWQWDGTA